jgi:hypothetical protein
MWHAQATDVSVERLRERDPGIEREIILNWVY